MKTNLHKTVLVLGANSDVAKQFILQYSEKGFKIFAASRDLVSFKNFVVENHLEDKVDLLYFDAVDFASHQKFYNELPFKPNVVLYSAGFLVQNEDVFQDFDKTLQMMHTNYSGAVSILNIIAMDKTNKILERIIGLSSLSGVRGRKSNFVYGSTKSAFTQYLAGLRQELADRKVIVNVLVSGYITRR